METLPLEIPGDRLLRVGEVAQKAGLSTRQIWALADGGYLPPSLVIGARSRRWRLSEIESWIQSGCPRIRTPKTR